MSTALTTPSVATLESVLIQGDLSKLTAEQRTQYYLKMCDTIGINPLTTPFKYLNLSGKLVLYATKDCTEQLRKIHGVSVVDVATQRLDDIYVVTTKVQDKTGRTDVATGAVPIGNVRGEALANLLMKGETKSKRRATLSICGLGMLDESEVDSIRGATVVEVPAPTKPLLDAAPATETSVEPAPAETPSVPVARTFVGARVVHVQPVQHPTKNISWAHVTFITTDGEELVLPTSADGKDAAVTFLEQLTPDDRVTIATDVGPRNGKERIRQVTREVPTVPPLRSREPGEDDAASITAADIPFSWLLPIIVPILSSF